MNELPLDLHWTVVDLIGTVRDICSLHLTCKYLYRLTEHNDFESKLDQRFLLTRTRSRLSQLVKSSESTPKHNILSVFYNDDVDYILKLRERYELRTNFSDGDGFDHKRNHNLCKAVEYVDGQKNYISQYLSNGCVKIVKLLLEKYTRDDHGEIAKCLKICVKKGYYDIFLMIVDVVTPSTMLLKKLIISATKELLKYQDEEREQIVNILIDKWDGSTFDISWILRQEKYAVAEYIISKLTECISDIDIRGIIQTKDIQLISTLFENRDDKHELLMYALTQFSDIAVDIMKSASDEINPDTFQEYIRENNYTFKEYINRLIIKNCPVSLEIVLGLTEERYISWVSLAYEEEHCLDIMRDFFPIECAIFDKDFDLLEECELSTKHMKLAMALGHQDVFDHICSVVCPSKTMLTQCKKYRPNFTSNYLI